MHVPIIALVVFFLLTSMKDFGIVFRYQDLLRGVAAFVVVLSLLFGRGFGL